MVPHDFGMSKPTLINSPEVGERWGRPRGEAGARAHHVEVRIAGALTRAMQLLKSKIEMVDALLNIEVTTKLLQEGTGANVDPVDAHYRSLNTQMEVRACRAASKDGQAGAAGHLTGPQGRARNRAGGCCRRA